MEALRFSSSLTNAQGLLLFSIYLLKTQTWWNRLWVLWEQVRPTLHFTTNIFTGRKLEREQRIYLWFGPTKAFHSYSVLWNIYLIVFLVDDVPIAMFKNNTDLRVKFLFRPTHEGIHKPAEGQQTSYLLQVETTSIHRAATLHLRSHSCIAIHGHPLVHHLKAMRHPLCFFIVWYRNLIFKNPIFK